MGAVGGGGAKDYAPDAAAYICNFCSCCAGHSNEPKAVIDRAKALTITWSHFRGTKSRKILHIYASASGA